jgi:hypothetical protein
MAITTKNRKDLKSNFIKNAIPTEQNFADLVDAQVNQVDDGVFKLAGEPFSVVAAAGGQKRVLRLYADYPTANPDWLISLNPAQDPANAATNRPGFGIADGAGNTRLFLDVNGRLGLNTNDPQGAIDARINGSADAWHRFVVTTTPNWGDAGAQHVTIGAGGAAGIMLSNPYVSWRDGKASINYGRTGGTAGDTYWDVGVRADGRFGFLAGDNGGGGEHVWINKAGMLTARAGLVIEGGTAHIDRDGALYRHNDGQVYITVDDNLYIRDFGATTWAAQFDTNVGNLNLKGALNADKGARVSGNGGSFSIEGTDHNYIQFFPQKIAGGRKGWIGYGSAGSTTLALTSEAGPLSLSGTAVSITGPTIVRGGVAVNDGSNTGVGRGLLVWNADDNNHVIYSANPQGKSPSGGTPPAGFHNGSHRMRFRTYSGQGFLFENHGEVALADIASDTGNLWTLGRATFAGGLTIPKGQPVSGVPITVVRRVQLRRAANNWTNPVPGQWFWDWTENYEGTIVGAWVATSANYILWGRNEPLRGHIVDSKVVSFSGKSVRLQATLGWLDFTGNWDDALDNASYLDVLVIIQQNVAV